MLQLTWIEPGATRFPPSQQALAEPDGLLAAGGDLCPEQLLAAYRRGIFPWFEEGQPVLWWTPDPRLVLLPEKLHLARSMKKLLRQQPFSVTTDRCFAGVMRACAEPRDGQSGTWITEQMLQAYARLHQLGYAHSVEVWQDDLLVGGLYGVALGKVFFGESMFSRRSNASKYGFILLTRALQQSGYRLIDCQVHSPHLASLGAEEIERAEFEHYLLNYIEQEPAQPLWPNTLGPDSSGPAVSGPTALEDCRAGTNRRPR